MNARVSQGQIPFIHGRIYAGGDSKRKRKRKRHCLNTLHTHDVRCVCAASEGAARIRRTRASLTLHLTPQAEGVMLKRVRVKEKEGVCFCNDDFLCLVLLMCVCRSTRWPKKPRRACVWPRKRRYDRHFTATGRRCRRCQCQCRPDPHPRRRHQHQRWQGWARC
jgi:hypothetical protein